MWSLRRNVVAGVVLSLALSGAADGVKAAEAPTAAKPAFDPVAAGADLVKQANWEAMQTVELQMSEYKYAPAALVFRSGQPYKLVLRNVGKEPHYFTALEVLPGGVLEFFFVPVTKGDFALCCTMAGHKENGMVGTIKVE